MLLIRLTNLIIFLFTLVCFILEFHRDGAWKLSSGLRGLRYFTLLSNLFSGFAALLVVLTVSETGLPFWVWLLKYIAAAAVAVTFLTVMVFLGPTLGYRSQLEGKGFYYHAGDLHWWDWPGEDPEWLNDQQTRFTQEIGTLADVPVDAAFVVLDDRLEEHYANGLGLFLSV